MLDGYLNTLNRGAYFDESAEYPQASPIEIGLDGSSLESLNGFWGWLLLIFIYGCTLVVLAEGFADKP